MGNTTPQFSSQLFINIKGSNIEKLCNRSAFIYDDADSAYELFEDHGCEIELNDNNDIIACTYSEEDEEEPIADLMKNLKGLVEQGGYLEETFEYEGNEDLDENEIFIVRWSFDKKRVFEESYIVLVNDEDNEISRRPLERIEL